MDKLRLPFWDVTDSCSRSTSTSPSFFFTARIRYMRALRFRLAPPSCPAVQARSSRYRLGTRCLALENVFDDGESRNLGVSLFQLITYILLKFSHSLELLTCLTSGSPCNQRIVSASARNTNHVRHQWCSIPLVWYPRCMRSGVWYAPPVAAPTFLIYITITDGYVGTSYT